MALRERLEADLREAMKAGDALRRETIRGVRGAIRNKEIELGAALDDDGILRVIRTLVKQRVEAIEQYRAGGRDDLVRKETAERESRCERGREPAGEDRRARVREKTRQRLAKHRRRGRGHGRELTLRAAGELR